MKITIDPTQLAGAITPPPSKSQAHRLLIAAALAHGESRISNVTLSQDIWATLNCMERLGAAWVRENSSTLCVRGMGGSTPLASANTVLPTLDCGESGSTLRFLIPIALAVSGGASFTGRGRLMERPQQPYFEAFRDKGITWEQSDGALTVRGRLSAGTYELPGNVSSQFFTGLLYALPLIPGASSIRSTTGLESRDYIAMTLDALSSSGIQISQEENQFSLTGTQTYRPVCRTVEADWSQAGFWYAAAGVGNHVTVTGMNERSIQGDRVILPWGERLKGGGDVSLDVSHSPDLVPPVAAWGALRSGALHIQNAARLRIKESDRLAAVTATLSSMGAQVEEHADGLTIYGRPALEGGVTIDCCNDHRIAMMAAIAATRCRQPVTLLGAECVAKSYPKFWEDYEALGGRIRREC